jgi:hypothetical protein
MPPHDDSEPDLINRGAVNRQNAIRVRLAQPSPTVATTFTVGPTPLQAVRMEVAKAEAGAATMTTNAEVETRQRLIAVLRPSCQAEAPLAVLAAVGRVAPKAAYICAALTLALRLKSQPVRVRPLFRETWQTYIDKRIARHRENHEDIPIRIRRRKCAGQLTSPGIRCAITSLTRRPLLLKTGRSALQREGASGEGTTRIFRRGGLGFSDQGGRLRKPEAVLGDGVHRSRPTAIHCSVCADFDVGRHP